MAQRVNMLALKSGLNAGWLSKWYSKRHSTSLYFEDYLIQNYFKNVFEQRGFFFKRCFIRRFDDKVFIFIEILDNNLFQKRVNRRVRHHTRFLIRKEKLFYSFNRIKMANIKKVVKSLTQKEVFLSVKNLLVINDMTQLYVERLESQLHKYKRFAFTQRIVSIFNIAIRTKGAAFLSRILASELHRLERRNKRNYRVFPFIELCGALVELFEDPNKAIHGSRIQLKGRFRGRRRPETFSFQGGSVPFNTLDALIDYSFSKAITPNGAYGIKVWICYK